jgi:hypothetical protein
MSIYAHAVCFGWFIGLNMDECVFVSDRHPEETHTSAAKVSIGE